MSTVYRGIGTQIARMKTLGPALQAVADDIEKTMIGVAAEHIDTTEYVRSIDVTTDKVSPSRQDRIVGPTDPAAIPIEYGWTDKQGNVHDGQHIVAKTLASIPRV